MGLFKKHYFILSKKLTNEWVHIFQIGKTHILGNLS